MFRVIFTYDEVTEKWDVTVEGASTLLEARQGFSAVVLTCQELDPELLIHAKVDENFRVTPTVR